VRSILVATDGSVPSERALTVAIGLARDAGATLHVVAVRPRWTQASRVEPSLAIDRLDPTDRILRHAVEQAQRAGVAAEPHVADGNVPHAILAVAGEVAAELVVVGTRGRTRITTGPVGRVSQALLRTSPVPVAVIGRAA
jgi:nucleotide-binding universal stress UspA family protein